MELQKTLRWTDPYESWGHHEEVYYKAEFLDKYIVPDTGLCNRLLHWETAYYILNQPKNKNFKILLQKKLWPELEIISLPNSYLIDYNNSEYQWQSYYEYDTLHFKTVFDTKNKEVRLASKIDESYFRKLINGNVDLSSDNHWYSDFGFLPLSDFSSVKNRFLDKIQLKHTEISNHIQAKYKDYVGIHIRRGNGVTYTEEDIQTLPKPTQEKYRKYREELATVQDKHYKFTPDDYYYKLIKGFIKENPSQKIYISHDLPDEYIGNYYDDFGHHVIESKYNNRYFYEHYYANAGVDVKHIKHYSNAVDNVIDLFTLSNCGMIIGSPHSTWSEFAKDYSPKLYSDSSEPIEDVLANHKNLTISTKSLL